jgi:uncharacterized protein (TIGR03067 family)
MFRLTYLVLLSFPLGLPALQEKKASNDADLLQGSWLVTGITRRGKALDANEIADVKVVFADNKMRLLKGPGKQDERSFTFELHQAKKPKGIDLTALDGNFKGRSLPGIYELDGASLKLCLPNDEVKERPSDFAAPEGTPLILLTLKKS